MDSSNHIGGRVVGSEGDIIETLYSLLNFDEGFIELVLPAQIILGEVLQMSAIAVLLGRHQQISHAEDKD